ncbi:hypothetical protein L1987_50723 [Smallanthus sonchifolius]|uniref:Uncharacterized protein n=1 Tax=Smallanthus sonchifolius TaxID=185202 RepID=A0ACB9EMU3_9ASTR|nr:hypothetical protein L1987_50723 [Smallanthus sonchifolius]
MAYRRRQGFAKDLTSVEEFGNPNPNSRRHGSPTALDDGLSSAAVTETPSLAAKAIRASSANRDSSLSSAYGQPAISPRTTKSNPLRSSHSSTPKDDSVKYDYTSMKNLEKPKRGFWGVLARKTRSIIEDDDDVAQQYETPERRRQQMSDAETRGQYSSQHQLPESQQKPENPGLQKGFGVIASSLNYIGHALEEGRTIVENRTADIIQETRKLNIKKKSGIPETQNTSSNVEINKQLHQMHTQTQPQTQTDIEIQLKASRDVSMAMAAKAKLLLRELKTVKADLAFAKERCAQLEEENKILREKSGGDGDNPEDDDLIRLQLESLLAEKARLAQENSVYARENRFLREIVEYHQLTMQDVVYIDENNEEVSQVYPINNLSTHDLQSLIIPTLPPSLSPTSSSTLNTNKQVHEAQPNSPFM